MKEYSEIIYGMEIEGKFFNNKNIIDIIIPIRLTENYSHIDRLYFLNELKNKYCNITIVDDGSEDKFSYKILQFCINNSVNYIKINSQHKIFSASRARNVGAMCSLCDYIIFKDFDVYVDEKFINNVLTEIKASNLGYYNNEFFVFPVIFLTQEGNNLFFQTKDHDKIQYLISAFLRNDKLIIENYGPGLGGGLLLVNRYHYLSLGGMDEQYTGWGCEDLDLLYRLVKESSFIIKPYEIDIFDKLHQLKERKDYIGFRTYMYVISEYFARKGMYGLHLYHKKIYADDTWYSQSFSAYNEKRLKNKISNKSVSEPLPALEHGKTLIIDKNAYSHSRNIMPFYGIIYTHNVDFFDTVDIISYIKSNNINRVIFTGPYGSDKKRNLYNIIRDNYIDFAVIERGALPDSIYVDDSGFCSESQRYDSQFWDVELDNDYIAKVNRFIKNYFTQLNPLEKQDEKIGGTELSKKLGIPADKKVLFVPLQTEYDVTMKFFCTDIGGFQGFISVLHKLTNCIPHDWVLVVKNHPLTDKKLVIPNAIMSDGNIDDLLSISSMVLLINSGVGVLAMLHFKPVLYMGDIFYAHNDINRKVIDINDILYYLNNTFKVDEIKIYKFIYYLIENFYCFGKSDTKKILAKNNSFITRTVNLKLQQIIVPWSNDRFYNKNHKPITAASIIFSKFNILPSEKLNRTPPKPSINASSASQPAKNYSLNRFIDHAVNNKNTLIYKILFKNNERNIRLANKFKKNPYAFCADSKHLYINIFRFLFTKK